MKEDERVTLDVVDILLEFDEGEILIMIASALHGEVQHASLNSLECIRDPNDADDESDDVDKDEEESEDRQDIVVVIGSSRDDLYTTAKDEKNQPEIHHIHDR